MTEQPVTVEDMMNARERRAFAQRRLLQENPGAAVVCLGLNIAGPIKTSGAIKSFFSDMVEATEALFAKAAVCRKVEGDNFTGPEAMWCVKDSPESIKQATAELEESFPAGRLLDIDVIRPDGGKVLRQDVGFPGRKCLLCGEEAAVCARSRRHPLEELQGCTKSLIYGFLAERYKKAVGELAEKALLTELCASPKPGLVDMLNSGAHSDMCFSTFVDSALSLREYFEDCVATGIDCRGIAPDECFRKLRSRGKIAERTMMKATGGVNTHKGAIYSLGIFCGTLGMEFCEETTSIPTGEIDINPASYAVDDGKLFRFPYFPEKALMDCADMTREGYEREMEELSEVTHGEQVYRREGLCGVRLEAAQGFPTVRAIGLPALHRAITYGMGMNDACLVTLLALMAEVADTNLAYRGGRQGMEYVRESAGGLLRELRQMQFANMEGFSEFLRGKMAETDNNFTKKHLSPGGSADLLALTLLAQGLCVKGKDT